MQAHHRSLRLAGQTLQPANPRAACITAMKSAQSNLGLTSLNTSGCSSWPTIKTTCVNPMPTATPAVAGTTPYNALASSGKYRIYVRWPVLDSDRFMTNPDLEKWGPAVTQDKYVNDGDPCDRMAIGISKRRLTPFGSVYGPARTTTLSRSVATTQIGTGPGDALVPLVVLDHHSCNALTTSGGGSGTGGIRVLSDGRHPGIIAVDSDGRGVDWDDAVDGRNDVIPASYDCGGSKTTINAPSNVTHIWAYDSPNGTPAEIFEAYALGSGSTGTAFKWFSPPGLETSRAARRRSSTQPNPMHLGQLRAGRISRPRCALFLARLSLGSLTHGS